MSSESSLKIGRFHTIVVDTEKITPEKNFEKATYRCNINCEDDANEWLHEFSKCTRTHWIVKQTYPNPERLQYHKKYTCAFSCKNKRAQEGISKRNLNCPVLLDIQIKLLTKDSKKKDAFLRQSDPLGGIITITRSHNHNKSATVLQYLRPTHDIREIFLDYFQDMSPAMALRVYQDTLKCREDFEEVLADGHTNPLDTSVYYWHKLWRLQNYGPLNEPLATLEKKIELYENLGSTVVVSSESPWTVLVATPVMKRAQSLFSTKSITFVDTTASVDSTCANVTVMLTSTKAGAVPIAVLIHESQSEICYTKAFRMFRETFPEGFGGHNYPHVFMSDNSSAEKGALLSVWPESIQLLCGFHVGQAEWQWLEKNVEKSFRQTLMRSFQAIQYAKSAEDLEDAIDALKTTSQDYYNVRVEGLLDRKKEWVQLFRAELPIGGHHTNNYAEATILVLKDIILQRTKAYNVVALVDYIINGWENYLKTRLSKHAYNRVSKGMIFYSDLAKKMPAEMSEKIEKIDEDTYLVPSSTTGEVTYEVIASVGSCMCKAGAAGAFCKHQALVHQKFGKIFPNQPLICSADRYIMGKLAFGEKCPAKEFFLGPKEKLEDLEKDLEEIKRLYSPNQSIIQDVPMVIPEEPVDRVPDDDSSCEDTENYEIDFEKFIAQWRKMFKYGTETNAKGFMKFMNRTTKHMERVSNHNGAFNGMMKTCAALKGNVSRVGKKIKVNAAAIARRRPQVTKGNSRLPSGRPKKSEDKVSKRKHILRESIAANRPHVRKH